MLQVWREIVLMKLKLSFLLDGMLLISKQFKFLGYSFYKVAQLTAIPKKPRVC